MNIRVLRGIVLVCYVTTSFADYYEVGHVASVENRTIATIELKNDATGRRFSIPADTTLSCNPNDFYVPWKWNMGKQDRLRIINALSKDQIGELFENTQDGTAKIFYRPPSGEEFVLAEGVKGKTFALKISGDAFYTPRVELKSCN